MTIGEWLSAQAMRLLFDGPYEALVSGPESGVARAIGCALSFR